MLNVRMHGPHTHLDLREARGIGVVFVGTWESPRGVSEAPSVCLLQGACG